MHFSVSGLFFFLSCFSWKECEQQQPEILLTPLIISGPQLLSYMTKLS